MIETVLGLAGDLPGILYGLLALIVAAFAGVVSIKRGAVKGERTKRENESLKDKVEANDIKDELEGNSANDDIAALSRVRDRHNS